MCNELDENIHDGSLTNKQAQNECEWMLSTVAVSSSSIQFHSASNAWWFVASEYMCHIKSYTISERHAAIR